YFLHVPPTPAISTLSLHDALPIFVPSASRPVSASILGASAATKIAHGFPPGTASWALTRYSLPQWLTLPLRMSGPRTARYSFMRSEEHTSELQSLAYLVCRLLLEK